MGNSLLMMNLFMDHLILFIYQIEGGVLYNFLNNSLILCIDEIWQYHLVDEDS